MRGRLHVLASKMSQTVAEIVSPILDKRKGGKTHSIRVNMALRKFLPNRFMTKMRERVRVREREKTRD